ncbi:MAG: UDP-N-acetylmuramoyl-L-alanyl-D-glutamate--2,6-diaminopimelate ligase [Polyangia bacterium]
MLRLSDLLQGISGTRITTGDGQVLICEVRDDSRLVQPGDLFIAVPGTRLDGRRFIDEAKAKGAAAILTEEGGASPDGATALVFVPNVRLALGVVAAHRYQAAQALTLTAVTGTNGKTTTTYLIEAILAAASRRPGVIGTVGYRFAGKTQEAPLTTPGALQLHSLFAQMKDAGCSDVVLEASSIALDQGRLHGCRFRVAGLSNITQDHLDYHGTMERYRAAKAILFRELLSSAGGVAVLFADDQDGLAMRREVRSPVLTLTRQPCGADVAVLDRRLGAEGTTLRLDTPSGPLAIASPLVGEFNLANILLATGMALAHGIDRDAITTGISRVGGVPGRLERVTNPAGVLCLVDYAHTPDALERALDVLRPLSTGRVLVVFGCGGDRDKSKRPRMGQAAAERADVVVVTSDNPRTEDPTTILDMIVAGVEKTGIVRRTASELRQGLSGFHVEPDRRAAIGLAVALARPGDTLLIAGKGHEDYQILGTQKIHFDDREVAAAALAARAGRVTPGGAA